MNSFQSPMSDMLKQDVVVVGGERRDDVRLIAELDKRQQVADTCPAGAARRSMRAAPTVVKNIASFGAPCARRLDGIDDSMLDEASIIRLMRRPG